MSKKQSNTTKEAVARIKVIFSELEKYLAKLPPNARLTMGDLAQEFSARFQLRYPDVKNIISFYFHVKYDINQDTDIVVRRGRTGGIQKLAMTTNNQNND